MVGKEGHHHADGQHDIDEIVQNSGELVYASGKDFADMRNAISCYNLTH